MPRLISMTVKESATFWQGLFMLSFMYLCVVCVVYFGFIRDSGGLPALAACAVLLIIGSGWYLKTGKMAMQDIIAAGAAEADGEREGEAIFKLSLIKILLFALLWAGGIALMHSSIANGYKLLIIFFLLYMMAAGKVWEKRSYLIYCFEFFFNTLGYLTVATFILLSYALLDIFPWQEAKGLAFFTDNLVPLLICCVLFRLWLYVTLYIFDERLKVYTS